jgi:hypothetical protein
MSRINYGGSPAVLVFGKDITESKQLERNVVTLHEQFKRLSGVDTSESYRLSSSTPSRRQ